MTHAFKSVSLVTHAFKSASLVTHAFKSVSLVTSAFKSVSLVTRAFKSVSLVTHAFKSVSMVTHKNMSTNLPGSVGGCGGLGIPRPHYDGSAAVVAVAAGGGVGAAVVGVAGVGARRADGAGAEGGGGVGGGAVVESRSLVASVCWGRMPWSHRMSRPPCMGVEDRVSPAAGRWGAYGVPNEGRE